MNLEKLCTLLNKSNPGINFKYKERAIRNNEGCIIALFVNSKFPFNVFAQIRIISDHNFYLKLFFGKILDFDRALFLVNELNMHTSACFKSCLYFDKDGYYLTLDYYEGATNENEATMAFNGAMKFLSTNKTVLTYLTLFSKLVSFVGFSPLS